MNETSDTRYATCVAAISMLNESAALDMTQDDFNFFTGDRIWLSTDRSRARRCVEAAVYGTLDFVGYPRFPAPAEFIAAAIAHFVPAVNTQTACLIMEGAEFTENIVNGVERPVRASELFAHVLKIRSGCNHLLNVAEDNAAVMLKMGVS